MTLGRRVAVMRDRRIQHVDVPQRLYDRPPNLFVAAFIGSPAMNLVHGRVSGSSVHVGQFEIPLGPELTAAGVDGEVIVGIRPEAFEDDEFAPAGLPQIGVVDTVRLAVDPTRPYFFCAQTGESLLGRVATAAVP
jgi:multiple sugar transport system ATP-binding protein